MGIFNRRKYTFLLVLFFLLPFITYGQNIKYSGQANIERYLLNVNNIKLPLNNAGLIGNVNVDSVGRGYIDDYLFLYSAGFYLSGYNEKGELWANSVSLSREDYIAGKVGNDSMEERKEIYILKESDVPFGAAWQKWKKAVELGAYFYDGDNDGKYNPVDKNGNGIWDEDEDKPDILGDETVWCVYNDGKPKEERTWLNDSSEPQGIEIRQTVWAYSNGNELDNVIFLRYSIINSGNSSSIHDSVYFSLWTDPDLDKHDNDLAGCDTNLNSGYVYNYNDINYQIDGEEQMCFFSSILQSPNNSLGNQPLLSSSKVLISSYFVEFDRYGFHQPGNPQQARNILTGKDLEGNRVDPCTSNIGNVFNLPCEEVNSVFLLSGDPILQQGWIAAFVNEARLFVNTGPFKLEVGTPVDIIGAYIIGRDTSELSSFALAREMAERVQKFYESNFEEYPSVSVNEKPNNLPNNFKLYQNYPNPFNPSTLIKYDLLQSEKVELKIYNALGQEIRTLVNEFQEEGSKRAVWNGLDDYNRKVSTGIYFYKISAGNWSDVKKMLLMK